MPVHAPREDAYILTSTLRIGSLFKDGRQRLDDLAGVAGGALSLLGGLRTEVESMARAQAEALVTRLDLARAEDLAAAMELARRATERADALEARLAVLEAKLGVEPPAAAEATAPEPSAPEPSAPEA